MSRSASVSTPATWIGLFLSSPRLPGEEEQYAAYKEIVAGLAPAPVTIRTLDVGGDKPLPGDPQLIGPAGRIDEVSNSRQWSSLVWRWRQSRIRCDVDLQLPFLSHRSRRCPDAVFWPLEWHGAALGICRVA